MPPFKNRSNHRYGRLLVKTHAGKDYRNKHLWLCKCDCGNTKVIVSDNLSSGKSNSCGCLKIEFLAKKGNQYGLYEDREEAILKLQYHHLNRRHKKLNYNGILLSFSLFKHLSLSCCEYCGTLYSRKLQDRYHEDPNGKKLSDTILKINGIDRVNSNAGYTKENSVACCRYCNFAKHTRSKKEFYVWVQQIYSYLFNKGCFKNVG